MGALPVKDLEYIEDGAGTPMSTNFFQLVGFIRLLFADSRLWLNNIRETTILTVGRPPPYSKPFRSPNFLSNRNPAEFDVAFRHLHTEISRFNEDGNICLNRRSCLGPTNWYGDCEEMGPPISNSGL